MEKCKTKICKDVSNPYRRSTHGRESSNILLYNKMKQPSVTLEGAFLFFEYSSQREQQIFVNLIHRV